MSAIEFVLLTPLLFAMIFLSVQAALYFFARHIVLTAAQQADTTARSDAASATLPAGTTWQAQAAAAAAHWISLEPELVQNAQVCYSLFPGQGVYEVQIEVTATVPSWIGAVSVSQTVTGPVEDFYPDDGQLPPLATSSSHCVSAAQAAAAGPQKAGA